MQSPVTRTVPRWQRSCNIDRAVPRALWTVVLAAGAGRRLSSLTGPVPKQFWRPLGGASLLETTLDRVAPLSAPAHTVVIVDRTHRPHADQLPSGRVGAVLYQPSDRGTATGVLMALMPVLESAPDALVLLTPSDHGVADNRRFRQGVLEVARHLESRDIVALFGAEPSAANDDYGWIVPADASGPSQLRPVELFVEKPPPDYARQLLAAGGVWNTMVVLARASALRALYCAHLADLLRVFDAALTLPALERSRFLERAYPGLQSRDFSHDVLAPARNLYLHTWPTTMGWTDLGTPDRLFGWFGPHHRIDHIDQPEAVSALSQ